MTPVEEESYEKFWCSEEQRRLVENGVAFRLAAEAGLKPLNAVVRRVLELIRNPDFSVEVIAEVIERDPSLASNVLRMANSAFFGTVTPCQSVCQAFMRLGAVNIEELVHTIVAAGMFNDHSGTGAFYRDHCAGTAAAARILAQGLSERRSKGSMLAGLMHDTGKLVLMQSGLELYKKTLDATDLREPDRIHLEERAALGYDHGVLGAHLLRAWVFPEPVTAVVALHHEPEVAQGIPELAPLVALLRLADHVEPMLARGTEPDPAALEELAEGPDCQRTGLSVYDLQEVWPDLEAARSQALRLFSSLGN